jgi:hypothetical protein
MNHRYAPPSSSDLLISGNVSLHHFSYLLRCAQAQAQFSQLKTGFVIREQEPEADFFLLRLDPRTSQIQVRWHRNLPSPTFSPPSLKRKVRHIRSSFCLIACLSGSLPPITFETVGRFVWHSVGRSCLWSRLRRHTSSSSSWNHSKFADVQTS